LDVIDRFAGGLSFVVSGLTASGGMVEIPVQAQIDRWGVSSVTEIEPSIGRAP
jgi:hypothetical protein